MNTKPQYKARKKKWITHDRVNNVTSIIRFVKRKKDGNYLVAVARAFKSPQDVNFSRKIGRAYAMDRMDRYFNYYNFIRNTKKGANFQVVTDPYNGNPLKARMNGVVTFFVGEESLMNEHELEIWHNVVLPNIEKELYSNQD